MKFDEKLFLKKWKSEMKDIVRNLLLCIICCAFTFIVGCELNGTSDNNQSAKDGKFVFGPVEGLRYECNDLSGETGPDGSYKYYEGENISFSIGDMFLGTAIGKSKITPYDFIGATKNTVTNICKFLISIDSDQNPINGFNINNVIGGLLNHNQELFPQSVCEKIIFDGKEYLLYYESEHDPSIDCSVDGQETLIHIKLDKKVIDETIFTLSDSEFENNSSMANLLLTYFNDTPIIYDINSNIYENRHYEGVYSNYWCLPESFWKYERERADNLLKISCYNQYKGLYTGSYNGSVYSGNLSLTVDINDFTNEAYVYGYSNGSNTCNTNEVSVYGNIIGYENGAINFHISDCNLYFKGIINQDSGTIIGSIFDIYNNYFGEFKCQKQL